MHVIHRPAGNDPGVDAAFGAFPGSPVRTKTRVAPGRRVTLTRALDHTRLDFSLGNAPAFAAFDGFVVRALREARLDGK